MIQFYKERACKAHGHTRDTSWFLEGNYYLMHNFASQSPSLGAESRPSAVRQVSQTTM